MRAVPGSAAVLGSVVVVVGSVVGFVPLQGSAYADLAPSPAPVVSNNCFTPLWGLAPWGSNELTPQGQDPAYVVYDANAAGIGTELGLVNPSNPDVPVNIVEDRSAAGAAWQSGYWFEDPGTGNLYVFNQSAGNMVGYQWADATFPGEWMPEQSDHYHPGGSFTNPDIGTAPCYLASQPVVLDNDQASWSASRAESSSGPIETITDGYDLQSLYNQTWPTWAMSQGIYLARNIAVDGGLEMYLYGPGWRSDPIAPQIGIAGMFDVSGVPSQYLTNACSLAICQYGVGDLSGIELVYSNIFGEAMAVNIELSPSDPITWLTSVANTYCPDWQDPVCGTIALNYYLQFTNNYTASAGAVRRYAVSYQIGSLAAVGQPGSAGPQLAPRQAAEPVSAFDRAAAMTRGKD